MSNRRDILTALAERRRELRMPVSALSERAGTSASTVTRALAGDGSVGFKTLCRLAQALGATVEVHMRPADSVIREEARRKAELVARLVQGTSALEAQAVDEGAVESIRRTVEAELRAHPGGKLWRQ